MGPIPQNKFPYKALIKPLFETLLIESERSQVVASKQDTMYHTSTNLNSSRSITTVFYWQTMTTFIFKGGTTIDVGLLDHEVAGDLLLDGYRLGAKLHADHHCRLQLRRDSLRGQGESLVE